MNLHQRVLMTCGMLAVMILLACKHEPPKQTVKEASEYPDKIAHIMESQCATAGCHNAASYQNAGGLQLDKWSNLFKGGSNGAAIVPYSAENSPLLYFINTHPDLGPVALPTMPYNGTPLSKDDYLLIRDWVTAGAPDVSGNVAFSSKPESRQKIYVTMQGCDLLGVIDADKRVVMRYVQIGKTPATEAPHCVRVSSDGLFAYVSFTAGEYVQKIDTRTDSVVAEAYLGSGSWNLLHISEDGEKVLVTNFNPSGNEPVLALIHTADMSVTPITLNSSQMSNPHGIASMPGFDVFYITRQVGNIVYKFTLSQGTVEEISIDENVPSTASSRNPHEILMTPDHSRYFLTCEFSNEVRVMDAHADTLIKVINVGIKPQEMALSSTRPLIFVTCMEDNSSFPGAKGSVYAIDYNTFQTTRIDGPFYQPHGITVDDVSGLFYVVSSNANTNGPAPHHPSSCGGRNGYYHVFDLNTLQRQPRRYEVSNDPYSADTRFK